MENRSVFSQTQLNKLLNPKSLQNFQELGGLVGIERGLRTNIQSGLSSDKTDLDGIATSNTISDRAADAALPSAVPTNQRYDTIIGRRRIFGENRLPVKKTKSIWALAWVAYNDKVLILLTVAAVISLSLGIYQSIAAKGGEARVQWVEGVAIVVAILIVVIVGAANDWQKERQFAKLNRKKEDRRVKVIRSAKTVEISVFDLVVGDVMHLEAGVLVPVDGIFIGGYNVKCDESSTTGESTLSRKVPGDDVYRAMIENHPDLSKLDPFIVSGSKVSEGLGAFLVTATGVNSIYGRTLLSLQDEIQTTPLQSKLNLIAEYIAKLGLGSALILFVVLFIKFLANLGDMDGADAKGQAFLQIFIVTVTIIVVAVPEGLPLAVTLALAFATTRMMKENNLVRFLRACETMGNATTVCSDKTGTLTQNKMSIVAGSVGTAVGFGNKLPRNKQEDRSNAFDNSSPSRFVSGLSTLVKEILLQSIVLNSTAFEGVQDGLPTILGSKTESALLSFAQHFLGLGSVHEYRCNAEVVQMFPFDPSRKCMAVVIRCASGEYRLFAKGAPDVLLSRATGILRDPSQGLTVMALEEQARSTLQGVLSDYASSSLRTIALLYRDFDQWPPRDSREGLNESTVFTDALSDLNFIGLLGIQDPLRPGVTESVQRCQRAGVFVRMVTGDNLMTAKAIAMECGIYTPGGIAMDGSRFRELSNCQMNQIIPRLQVLARSTPEDKKILVSQLQKLGETVAVTGDGTNDAPALRTADVGFAMGIMGTDVAKEASDIILMDDNFSSIVTAIAWGRTVNDAVKKFLQFQITVNITAVIITFVSAVASSEEASVLTAVQLLWVNLIMDTFAALALATDPPSSGVFKRRPEPRSAPLITMTMWKMITGQSIYKLTVTLVMHFAGKSIFGYSTDTEIKELDTMVFNTFVWMQIFNQYNSRRIDNQLNIFEGIIRNQWFIGIQIIIIAGQTMIIFLGGQAFSVHRLSGLQWGYCLILGAISIPGGVIIRLIPDRVFTSCIHHLSPNIRQKHDAALDPEKPEPYEWNPSLEEIRNQLRFLKVVHGGRLKNIIQRSRRFSPWPGGEPGPGEKSGFSTFVDNKDPKAVRQKSSSHIQNSSPLNSVCAPAAAMAGVVAGSIAGWSPAGRGDSIPFSSDLLSQQVGIEVHPDTRADDPMNRDHYTLQVPPGQNPDLVHVFDISSAEPIHQRSVGRFLFKRRHSRREYVV